MFDSIKIGVLGAGSFGTAISNLIAKNREVILYVRDPSKRERIEESRMNNGQKVDEKIQLTSNLELVIRECELLFPVVPSSSLRTLMKDISPFVSPHHILIHGTKGLGISDEPDPNIDGLSPKDIFTMSEIILKETSAVKVGVISGPNLAKEISEGQPAGAVVASKFQEVIKAGRHALQSNMFQVFGSYDVRGVELAGAFKNIIAIGSGIVGGLGFGENSRALLISRGLTEVVHVGKALGMEASPFLGIAGIGDLIATCYSPLSRNYTVGYKLGQGEKLPDILKSMSEVAEGINTITIIKNLTDHLQIRTPITHTIYSILFNGMNIQEGYSKLMEIKNLMDVDFMEG